MLEPWLSHLYLTSFGPSSLMAPEIQPGLWGRGDHLVTESNINNERENKSDSKSTFFICFILFIL